MQLRIGEEYVRQFGKLAKESTTLIVPGNLSDLASVVTMATSIVRKRRPRSLKDTVIRASGDESEESNHSTLSAPELKSSRRASTWRLTTLRHSRASGMWSARFHADECLLTERLPGLRDCRRARQADLR